MNVTGLPADVSIGISDNNQIVHFKSPTPGFKNSSSYYEGSNQTDIIFSHDGGSFTGEINLSLSGVSSDEVIRYTLDASEPDENSLIYSTPIKIGNTTVVRARVLRLDIFHQVLTLGYLYIM